MELHKTLKTHVYEYIESEIQKGNLIPKQRINENVICEALNVSRTPVREALIQLAAEGILENTARKGFVLKTMEAKEVEEIYAVVGVLDGFAASLACNFLTDKDIMDLKFYVDTMNIAIQSDNFEMYQAQQQTFHNYYIYKCGNNALIETIERVKCKLFQKPYVNDSEGKMKEILLETNREHQEIWELFKAKDQAGLQNYLSKVHWRAVNAPYDTIL